MVLKEVKQKRLTVDNQLSHFNVRSMQLIGMMSLSLPVPQHKHQVSIPVSASQHNCQYQVKQKHLSINSLSDFDV